MARTFVLSRIPPEHLDAANVFYAALTGDDEGAINFTLNASEDGNPPATDSVSNTNNSQSEADVWVNWLANHEGCDSKVYAAGGPTPNFWAEAWNWWGLKPADEV